MNQGIILISNCFIKEELNILIRVLFYNGIRFIKFIENEYGIGYEEEATNHHLLCESDKYFCDMDGFIYIDFAEAKFSKTPSGGFKLERILKRKDYITCNNKGYVIINKNFSSFDKERIVNALIRANFRPIKEKVQFVGGIDDWTKANYDLYLFDSKEYFRKLNNERIPVYRVLFQNRNGSSVFKEVEELQFEDGYWQT